MFGSVAFALLLAFAAAPVAASTFIPAVFDFTVGGNSGVVDGNRRKFTAHSPEFGTFNVWATAWSLEKVSGVTYLRDSRLMVYPGGLGVISGDDDGGANYQHTVDNHERRDFILFQFDRQVRLVSATFDTWSVNRTGVEDSDATFKYGVMTGGLEWDDSLQFLNNQNMSALNALFTGGYTSLGGAAGGTRALDSQYVGDIWLVGAAFENKDYKIDGFKLTSLGVIPEPATWAMMIGGFGLVGGALRRRSRRETAIA